MSFYQRVSTVFHILPLSCIFLNWLFQLSTNDLGLHIFQPVSIWLEVLAVSTISAGGACHAPTLSRDIPLAVHVTCPIFNLRGKINLQTLEHSQFIAHHANLNQREKDNKFNQKKNLLTCQCVFLQPLALIQDNLSSSSLNSSHNFTWKGVIRTRRIDILWNIFLHVVDVYVTRTVNACVLVG